MRVRLAVSISRPRCLVGPETPRRLALSPRVRRRGEPTPQRTASPLRAQARSSPASARGGRRTEALPIASSRRAVGAVQPGAGALPATALILVTPSALPSLRSRTRAHHCSASGRDGMALAGRIYAGLPQSRHDRSGSSRVDIFMSARRTFRAVPLSLSRRKIARATASRARSRHEALARRALESRALAAHGLGDRRLAPGRLTTSGWVELGDRGRRSRRRRAGHSSPESDSRACFVVRGPRGGAPPVARIVAMRARAPGRPSSKR